MSQKFAQQLKTWRKAHAIKQQHLADLIGVSQSAISHWESGRESPSPQAFAKLTDLIAGKSLELAPQEALIVGRQLGLKTLHELDGARLIAVSPSMRKIWPQSDAYLGNRLADYLINQLAELYFDDFLRASINKGDTALISGVTERDLSLPECLPLLCRWSYVFRRFGVRTYAELTMEVCDSPETIGVRDILRIDEVAR